MTATNATWMKHPGYYIREEMEAREWLQRDLAFILGVPEQAVNMILSGKRGISPDMALALADAFGTDREFFANLQNMYDLAHARTPDPSVAMRGSLQSTYPVREMIRRGWIKQSAKDSVERELVRFFEVSETDEIPYVFAHAAKRSKYEDREIPPAQLAWLFRVRHIAQSITAPVVVDGQHRIAVIRELERLMTAPEEARHVPELLSRYGIRFVVVEKLPGANIDGVCFWLNESPVIGMSMRFDRIDNFWFVLRHELEHVFNGDGRDEEVIDVLDAEGASETNANITEQERRANAAAADFCVPAAKMDSFIIRKKPYYYEKDVLSFAKLHHRHPGIVVGQMQKRLDRWDYLTRHLVKIRQHVLPNAYVDGWGQTFPGLEG